MQNEPIPNERTDAVESVLEQLSKLVAALRLDEMTFLTRNSVAYSRLQSAFRDGMQAERDIDDQQLWNRIEEIKRDHLNWIDASKSAAKWWNKFEDEFRVRPSLVLRLVEELQHRKSTINEFFLAYVYSNTDNIQANLHYLDYMKLKEADDNFRRS